MQINPVQTLELVRGEETNVFKIEPGLYNFQDWLIFLPVPRRSYN